MLEYVLEDETCLGEDETVGLNAPWVTYWKEMQCLFGQDPMIAMEYDEEDNLITVKVEDEKKALALTQILPSTVQFGNITLKIQVIPPNEENGVAAIYRAAFEGNPVFSKVVSSQPAPNMPKRVYCLFKPTVCQFWNDDLSQYRGFCTKKVTDIANDLLRTNNMAVLSTDVED